MITQRAEPETLFTLRLPLPSCDEKKVNEMVQPTVDHFSLNALHKSLVCNTADSGKIIKLSCYLCCSFCYYFCCSFYCYLCCSFCCYFCCSFCCYLCCSFCCSFCFYLCCSFCCYLCCSMCCLCVNVYCNTATG